MSHLGERLTALVDGELGRAQHGAAPSHVGGEPLKRSGAAWGEPDPDRGAATAIDGQVRVRDIRAGQGLAVSEHEDLESAEQVNHGDASTRPA